MVSLPTVALRSGINGGFYSLSFPVVQESPSVSRRGRCEESLLQPCAATLWAELCRWAVHTHCVSHEPLPCHYFILGHQQIEAVFQLLPNISSFMKRTPAQRHTQWAQLCCPPCILLPTGDFQHDPCAPWHDFVPVWQGGWVGRDRVIYCPPLLRACFLCPHQHDPCALYHCSHHRVLAATWTYLQEDFFIESCWKLVIILENVHLALTSSACLHFADPLDCCDSVCPDTRSSHLR